MFYRFFNIIIFTFKFEIFQKTSINILVQYNSKKSNPTLKIFINSFKTFTIAENIFRDKIFLKKYPKNIIGPKMVT